MIPYYLKQLATAGWKMGALASSGAASIASTEATDAEGKLWHGALIAWQVRENELYVAIEMARPSGP